VGAKEPVGVHTEPCPEPPGVGAGDRYPDGMAAGTAGRAVDAGENRCGDFRHDRVEAFVGPVVAPEERAEPQVLVRQARRTAGDLGRIRHKQRVAMRVGSHVR